METDVYESPTRTQDARRLAQEPVEVIHIRVRKRRENGVERPVGKGQLARIRQNQFGGLADTLPREPKLILGDVGARDRPAEFDQCREVEAAAASEVEAAASS
jgi:hypothetical protein